MHDPVHVEFWDAMVMVAEHELGEARRQARAGHTVASAGGQYASRHVHKQSQDACPSCKPWSGVCFAVVMQ